MPPHAFWPFRACFSVLPTAVVEYDFLLCFLSKYQDGGHTVKLAGAKTDHLRKWMKAPHRSTPTSRIVVPPLNSAPIFLAAHRNSGGSAENSDEIFWKPAHLTCGNCGGVLREFPVSTLLTI